MSSEILPGALAGLIGANMKSEVDKKPKLPYSKIDEIVDSLCELNLCDLIGIANAAAGIVDSRTTPDAQTGEVQKRLVAATIQFRRAMKEIVLDDEWRRG